MRAHERYELDLVCGISRVVNDCVHLVIGRSIDVAEQPIAKDIGLDPPGELETTFSGAKVDKSRFGILDSTDDTLECVCLVIIDGLCGRSVRFNWELQHACSAPESVHGLGNPPLSKLNGVWYLTLVKGRPVREDAAVFVNLKLVSR